MDIGVVVWYTTGRGFIDIVGMMRGIAIVFGNTLIFLPLRAKDVITSFHLVKPFIKIGNLVQLLR